MSPVDPIQRSPTSTSPVSMDTSAITPTYVGSAMPMSMPMDPNLALMPTSAGYNTAMPMQIPPTPIIAPSVFLPRLITSFHHPRISSGSYIQFVLPTSSPLALSSRSSSSSEPSSPQTAVLIPAIGRPFAVAVGTESRSHSRSTLASATASVSVSPRSSNESNNSNSSPSTTIIAMSLALYDRSPSPSSPGQTPIRSPMVGTLDRTMSRRAKAMEGFERMGIDSASDSDMENENEMSSPEIERIIQLPLPLPLPLLLRPHDQNNDNNTLTYASQSESLNNVTSQMFVAEPAAEYVLATGLRSRPRASMSTRSAPSKLATAVPSRLPIQKGHRHQHRRRNIRPCTAPLIIQTPQPQIQSVTQNHHFQAAISYLAHPLVPLVSVTSGIPHPAFPRTLLNYHLLTHEQLDDLARHYHQTIGARRERWMYPCPVGWGRGWCGGGGSIGSGSKAPDRDGWGRGRRLVDLETKRRRWGRFIGLRGCESPTTEAVMETVVGKEQEEEDLDLVRRMEREWLKALSRAEEDSRVREKVWGRRF